MIEEQQDAALDDDDLLWRRVRRSEVQFDENLQRWRPTSQAFQNYKGTDKMSVQAARLIHFSHDAVLGPAKDDFIVQFPVKLAKECGQHVIAAFEEGPGHFHVLGKKRGSVASRLAKECTWVKGPDA